METILSFLPLVLTLLLGYLGWRWLQRQSHTAPTQVAIPIPEYKGPLGVLRRHYNGDYSLARSYWGNTLLITLFAPTLGFVLLPLLSQNLPARYASTGALFITALGLFLWTWAVAGTWASADKHVSRGGKPGWASAAKLAIVFGVLRTFTELGQTLPSLSEHWHVAIGEQPGAALRLELRADGKSLLLAGGINDGGADQLARALDLAPAVATVVLESDGGWIREGVRMAEIIRTRGLHTYVETSCSSACTLAFLAGRDRAAAPTARIGFHSPHGVGATEPSENVAAVAQLEQLYRQAGLPEWMLRKIADTPSDRMWYPTVEELLTAGVLTRRSEGGETATLATKVRSKAALVENLKKVDALAALAERFPQEFEATTDAAWGQVQQGATDAQIMATTRTRLAVLIPRLLPGASDAVLLDYWRLVVDQLLALSVSNPAMCAQMAFSKGQAVNILPYLPAELTQRELALNARLIRDFDVARVPKADPVAMERYMGLIGSQMTPEQLKVFADPAARVNRDQLVCDALLAFFRGFQQVEPAKRVQALRLLYVDS